ncbi:ABC transporter permease [Rhodothalassium salexigens]|uniref:ABC transporter permease n=1 Tax=Rhodothalassium salexigens TaxID=1086 RepID=UPI00191163AD|nr:ABC transporter permease [Rhodothalassium salexigens]
MGSLFRQIRAAIALNILSIPQRLWLSVATVGSIALAVGVLMAFLSLAEGFRSMLQGTGSDTVAILLRDGATVELNSGISRDQVRLVEAAPGLAVDAAGDPLLSGEVYVTVDAKKRNSGASANLSLRGVTPAALQVRDGVRVVDGRMVAPGSNELIVGRRVSDQFVGFDLGRELVLGNSVWRVVGIFAAEGVFESEVWADLDTVRNLFNRGSGVQSVRARFNGADGLAALQAYVEAEPRLNLDVQTEAEFYADQSSGTVTLISYFGWPLAICLAIGALAGAINAMNSSVESRARETATLRAIGFRGVPAFFGVMVEALFLAFLGGLLATLCGYLVFNVAGWSVSTLGEGFTQVVFDFTLTPAVALTGLVAALVIGLLGGLAPAVRAARLPILQLGAR